MRIQFSNYSLHFGTAKPNATRIAPQVAKAAPFVEKLVASGKEVLYLTEPIDEATVTNLAKYNDFELVRGILNTISNAFIAVLHTVKNRLIVISFNLLL